MADQPNAAATTPLAPTVVQPGPAQPAGGFTVPDGKMLVDSTEYQRHQEQLRGSKSFVEAARKHGFDKPESFEKYGKFSSVLKQRNLSLDQLMQAFDSPDAGADAAEAQGFSPAQIDQYLQKQGYMTKDVFDKERAFDRAEFEYKTEAQREQELYKQALAEFIKETPEDEHEFWEALAERETWNRRATPEVQYPKEHPLAEKYMIRPLKEPEIKSVIQALAAKRDLRKGAKLAALGGKAAKPGVTSTPAGSSASSPTTLPKSHSDDKRPGGKPTVAEAEAWHAKRKQQRGGGPVSSMGG